MDQTSVTKEFEEEELTEVDSSIVSTRSGSGGSVPDDCHSTLSDDLSVDWTKLVTEKVQIGFFLTMLPKFIPGLHVYKNAKFACYAEIDLILKMNDVFILVEAKRSVTKQMLKCGREQVTRYCNCFRALYPDSRVIGFLYSPLGPKLVCDIGNRSAWDPFFQPLFDTIHYRGYKKPKRWNRRPLQSQSGSHPYTRVKKGGDLPMLNGGDANSGGAPSVVVHAGAHHSVRMRASKPSSSPWSMNNIFNDATTAEADRKFLKAKFVDEQRSHFASSGSASCDVKQDSPLQGLLKEMRVSVPSSDGMSTQETVQTVPADDHDVGV